MSMKDDIYLALSDGDLVIEDGKLVRVGKGRFVAQQVQCKLRTVLGEWLLDQRIGMLSKDDLVKHFSVFDIETRAREIILKTQGVHRVVRLTSNFDHQTRRLSIEFAAETEYGEIDSTVKL